jgi:hypothetical protein
MMGSASGNLTRCTHRLEILPLAKRNARKDSRSLLANLCNNQSPLVATLLIDILVEFLLTPVDA